MVWKVAVIVERDTSLACAELGWGGGWGKVVGKLSLGKPCLPAVIRSGYFPNTSLGRNRYAILLSEIAY